MLYFCRPALIELLQGIAQQLNATVLSMRLYQNDWEPSPEDDAGDYVQATFTGYAALNLEDFGASFLNLDLKAEINGPAHIFSQTGVAVTNMIYGYYIVNNQNALVWAERNEAGPVAMNAAGMQYSVVPVVTLDNEGPLAAAARQGAAPGGGKIVPLGTERAARRKGQIAGPPIMTTRGRVEPKQ